MHMEDQILLVSSCYVFWCVCIFCCCFVLLVCIFSLPPSSAHMATCASFYVNTHLSRVTDSNANLGQKANES